MRAPKKPLSAWIVQNREAQDPPWKSEELARRLGVSDSTVRGWEAGRSVSAANLTALERLFGVTAPGHEQAGDMAALIAALTAHTAALHDSASGKAYTPIPEAESLATAIAELTTELREARRERRELAARIEEMDAVLDDLVSRTTAIEEEHAAHPHSAGSGR